MTIVKYRMAEDSGFAVYSPYVSGIVQVYNTFMSKLIILEIQYQEELICAVQKSWKKILKGTNGVKL